MKKLFHLMLVMLFFAGCNTFYAAIDSGGDNVFENNMVVVEKKIQPLQVDLKITNKSDKDIEIVWDKCVYVDLSGESYKIVHSHVQFTEDKQIINPQTIIKPKETHSDFLLPIAAIKNLEKSHERKIMMWATHHETVNQIYKIGDDIDYRNESALKDLIGREYKIYLVVLSGSDEKTLELKGKLTEIIDLLNN
ncbi:MAG: hypothetical protein JW904_10435 [Spirochaetales bacterium]|nr:hypothetical protein [Spirochaetales bacterium]